MQLDLSADYLCWDNVESVGYESARAGAPVLDAVSIAKRRNVRAREKSPSRGAYVGFELFWLLPARQLSPGLAPKMGDAVIDKVQQRWTVLTSELNRNGETWKLGCVDLELAADLRDSVDVERAGLEQDASGATVKRFPSGTAPLLGGRVLYQALPCRVQLVTEDVADERGVRAFQRAYDVIVGRPVPQLVSEDRVRWLDQTGPSAVTRYLDVVRVRNPERIDELWIVECEARF